MRHTMCRRTFLICYEQSEKVFYLWPNEHVPQNEIIEIIWLYLLYIYIIIFSHTPSVCCVCEKYIFRHRNNLRIAYWWARILALDLLARSYMMINDATVAQSVLCRFIHFNQSHPTISTSRHLIRVSGCLMSVSVSNWNPESIYKIGCHDTTIQFGIRNNE